VAITQMTNSRKILTTGSHPPQHNSAINILVAKLPSGGHDTREGFVQLVGHLNFRYRPEMMEALLGQSGRI
jgi:hypothetical protein